MHVRLTLRAADGEVIVMREITPRSLASLSDEVGQAAQALYGEAHQAGCYPVWTTLTVEEHEPDMEGAVARAIQRGEP